MIKTREEFEARLKELKEDIKVYQGVSYISGYYRAIKDVLRMIEDEGGCFKK